MKLRPVQKSFASGEITPKLRSRPDLKFYQEGLEELVNWVTTPFGSVIKRGGTRYIDEVSNTLEYGRLFTYRVDGTNTFVVVVTTDAVTVYNKNAAELETAGSNFTLNHSFDNQGDDWNVNIGKATPNSIEIEPSITFPNGTAIINSGNAAEITFLGDTDPDNPRNPFIDVDINASDAELTQEVTVNVATNIHALVLDPINFIAQGTVTDYLSIGTTEGASDIAFTVDPLNSNRVTFTPGVVTFWISYKLNWDDSLNPTVQLSSVHPNQHTGTSAVVSFDAILVTDTEAAGGEDVVSFASPWTEQEIRELQVEKAPGQNIMYMCTRSATATQKLERDPSTAAWTLTAVTFIGGVGDAQDQWAASGYPGSITFFQGRMWLAGSRGHPATVWGSVAGEDNYEDFTTGGATDDDALELPLARDGVIQWIQGGKALHVGLDNSEHVVTGDTAATLLTPTNARTFQQSSYGSYRIHGKWFSEKVSFISNDQRRIYVGDYDRETLGFKSDEISYIAEHITFPGLLESHQTQNPRAHIFCVRADGEMVASTYQREAGTNGWHHHQSNFGNIVSVTTTEEQGSSIVWVLFVRSNKLYLEKSGSNFLDSHVVRQYGAAQTLVDGLDHLEGFLVDVVGDGAFAGSHTVISGQVTVQHAATSFVVGLPYVARLVTHPVETLNLADNITPKLKRWNKIFARMLFSIPPVINGVRGGTRTAPTPMGLKEPNKTEDIEIATVGWDRDAKVTIEQDMPFYTEITGIYGELNEDGF